MEVQWAVPEGFTIASEPETLGSSLVGEMIYMRWEKPYGWQVGKVTDVITRSTPRLVQKFSRRVVWADGSKGPSKLAVENYGGGPNAKYNMWVVLKPATSEL